MLQVKWENNERIRDIVVISYIWSKENLKETKALLAKAYELSGQLGCEFYACFYVQNEEFISDEMKHCGAKRIYVLNVSESDTVNISGLVHHTKEILMEIEPDIVLFETSKLINDIAPILAVEFQTGLTAECIDFRINESDRLLLQVRTAYEGNMMATIICPEQRPQMATAKLQATDGLLHTMDACSEVCVIDASKDRIRNQQKIDVVSTALQDTEDAEGGVYISIGRGVKTTDESLQMIYSLADILGAKVVGTRAVVDAGILDYSCQIGLTGKTISPKVYIACGVSGALQHMAGIQSADCMIAINQDADAEIFKLCDYGIVGKVEEVIPMLMKELKRGVENQTQLQ